MSRSRRRLALVGFAGVAVALAASDALLISGHAAQDDTQAVNYSLFNGQVIAAADREQVFTGADPGLGNGDGAVDNFYPYARVGVTSAGTEAHASPVDTGPLFQAVVAGQGVTQPQYVDAQYPGTENPHAYSAGLATASASVTPASGTASATYGAVGNTTTGAFDDQPSGSDGGTARTTAYFDDTLGFTTIGDSRVHHASYTGSLGGHTATLTIDNLRVLVRVTSNGLGSFQKTISVVVGSASVTADGNTVPVVIDQNGVTVAGSNEAPFSEVQAVSKQLNGLLAQAGISIRAVPAVATQQGDDLHVDAEGVVVEVVQQPSIAGVSPPTLPPPLPGNGLPQQFVRHTLGSVSLDNEAVSSPVQPDQVPPPPPALGGGGGGATTTTIINNAAAVNAPPPAAPVTPVATPGKRPGAVPISFVLTSKPMSTSPLVLGYLAWQALMIALAGALYMQRSAQRRVQ